MHCVIDPLLGRLIPGSSAAQAKQIGEASSAGAAFSRTVEINDETALNLQPSQVKQAEGQMASADSAVAARVPEAYQWLLVPAQANHQAPIEWQAIRLSGQEACPSCSFTMDHTVGAVNDGS